MSHWTLLYYSLAFILGMLSVGLVAVIFIKTRAPLARAYLALYLPFSFLTALEILSAYIETNVPVRDQTGLILLFFLDLAMTYVFMFTLPVFTHELYALASRKRWNLIIGLIVLGAYLGWQGLTWLGGERLQPEPFTFFLLDLPLVGMTFYCLLLSIRHYQQADAPAQQARAGKLLGVFSGLTLIVLEDTIIGALPSVLLYPVAYAGVGLFFSWYFLEGREIHPAQRSSPASIIPTAPPAHVPVSSPAMLAAVPPPSVETLCAQYQISPREKEVLALLLQGCTNAQIAEKLFISVNTAKTHISNIYEKVGVKRRYELLARFQIAPPSDPSPDAS